MKLLWLILLVPLVLAGCSALPDEELGNRQVELENLNDKMQRLKVGIMELPRLTDQVEKLELERDKLKKKREALKKR